MESNKRKLCLITNWYPTKEKPYNGIFFKEQAFALSDSFEFIVVHYKENKKIPTLVYLVRRLMRKHILIKETNVERNTIEYDVIVFMPMYLLILNMLCDLLEKHVKHNSEAGIGSYVSGTYQKHKKKVLEKVFSEKCFEEIDALYCVNAQKESFTLQCASEILQKPYIVAEHAPFPWPGSSLCDIEKRAIENADLFMAISYDKIRQVLLQNVKLNRIAYVGNLVDENQFRLAKGVNEVKTFIIVAAHSFYKNYGLFIEIFNRLTEITDASFRVMVVGYGSNKGYSKNADELEKRIMSSKFSKCAELIPEVSHDKIQDIYVRADAFVMTSIQEGMPVSALEAACCGLPIFSTMCGGVEDYVDDKIGRIYKVIDSESFANGLKDYLEGRISFEKEYIREQIVEKFGKKAFVNRMTTEINRVIDE